MGSWRKRQIYIYLQNEGADVWRPAFGLEVGDGIFVVLLPSDYEQLKRTEEWEFPPGSIVRCQEEVKCQGVEPVTSLVAKSRIDIEELLS